MPRITEGELTKLVKRLKYGVPNAFGKGAFKANNNSSGAEHNLESITESSFQGEKGLQINYTGKVLVSIVFYRYRLADYDRAISEKALLDCAIYSGLIRDDSLSEIRFGSCCQKKVGSKAEERTEITLEYPEVDFDNLWVRTGRTDGR